MEQLQLFSAVSETYAGASGPVSQTELYAALRERGALSEADLSDTEPVGQARAPVNLAKRRVRWMQQTLKKAGVIEPADERGVWQLTEAAREGAPRPVRAGVFILGFCTDMGMAVIADCHDFFQNFDEPIHLILTSPPYPLRRARAYGNVDERRYVDWLCETMAPAIALMAPGASLCLNVGNDVFLANSPARSLYQERLVLALADRFGLFKMDGLVWSSNKAPGPMQWASKRRVQLNTGYEMVWWFTNDPERVMSNNQSVLVPHSAAHLDFVRRGGERRARQTSNGAYRMREGAYSKPTAGKIPTNVIHAVRSGADRDKAYRDYCEAHGLARHGASMPVALADFLIRFLTRQGQLVVDNFAGRCKTGLAAERLGRRWVCVEKMADYVLGSQAQFS